MERWICATCSLDDQGDWVDDHSPPCDCCDLECDPEAVRLGQRCDQCGKAPCAVFRYVDRATYDSR